VLYIRFAITIKMKKLLLLTSLFCLLNFVVFSQLGYSDTCDVIPKSYKIVVKQRIVQNLDSKHIIPRELKELEYCLINKHRHATKMVVISLDEKHELIIFPYSDVK